MGSHYLIHKDGKRVIFFSEDGSDNTDRFPISVRAIQDLKIEQAIFDVEIELWKKGNHQPREAVTAYVHSKTLPDDSEIVLNILGLLYKNGEDLHKKSEIERRKLLEEIPFPQSTLDVPKPGLNLIPSMICKSREEFRKAVEDLSHRVASEGVIVKRADAEYYLDGTSRGGWLKLHKTVLIKGIVIEPIETKVKGVFNHRFGIAAERENLKEPVEVKGKTYAEVGKTFSTAVEAKIGDIIEVEAETFNYIEDLRDGTIEISAWAPRFMGISKEPEPDTIQSVRQKAKYAEVLQEKTITKAGETLFEMDFEALTESDILSHFYATSGIKDFELSKLLADDEPEVETLNEALSKERIEELTKEVETRPKFHAVLDRHFRGKSAHADFRVKVNGSLEGWTLTDTPKGEIKEDIDTLEKGREATKTAKWKFNPGMDPDVHVVAVRKATQPLIWLMVNDKSLGADAVMPPGSVGACLNYEAPVLTGRGMLPIGEIKEGDYVIGSSGKLRRVEKAIITENEKRTCYEIFWNRYAHFLATEDHPFLVGECWFHGKQLSKELKNIRWMTASEIAFEARHAKERLKFVIPRSKGTNLGSFEDGLIIGFILGDGSIRSQDNRIELYFNAGKEGRLARAYQHILRLKGIESQFHRVREGPFGFCLEVCFVNKELKNQIETLRKNPMSIFDYSKEFARGVYEGLLDADGYKNQITQKEGCVKVLLPFVMYHADRLYCERRDERTGCYSLTGRLAIVSEDGEWLLQSIQIRKAETPKKTYNLQVEIDESYLTALNISHNTRFEEGVFILEAEGFAYKGVEKPYFYEYFLDMPARFDMQPYTGRMIVRLIGVRPEWEKAPKGALQWQAKITKEDVPYLLTKRARDRKDYIPKDGEKALSPKWEEKIASEFKWWTAGLTDKEKLKRLDLAYNDLVSKGELKEKPIEIKEDARNERVFKIIAAI